MSLLTPTNLKTVRFELNGLEAYLQKIEAAGMNAEEAVREALPASAQPIYDDIKAWAEKHKLSGATLEGLNLSKVEQDGNKFTVDVGIDSKKAYNAWHAVFVEYGTPTNEADPGIRRAFESNKARVRKIQQNVLKARGVPVN